MKKLKSIKLMAPIILSCFLLCSCWDFDPYEGKRPIDYPNSYWVCEEEKYDMYFLVGEDQELADAKITIYGQTVPCKFIWRTTNNRINIVFEIDSQLFGMSGSCKFGKEKFTIQIEYKDSSEEGPVIEFERRTLEEYLADHG